MKRAARMIMHAGFILLLSMFTVSCALVTREFRAYEVGYREVGMASWYGPGFHGRKTSSGEVYDMFQFTAAHRTMPFGTTLKVTNLENGRWVQVRVNDRGPFIRGRMLDLSYGAAQALNMVGPGVVKVNVRVVGRAETLSGSARKESVRSVEDTSTYAVQVGSFRYSKNAYKLKQSLEKRYQPVYIVASEGPGRTVYRVRVGKLQTWRQAEELSSRLSTLERLEAFVVRED